MKVSTANLDQGLQLPSEYAQACLEIGVDALVAVVAVQQAVVAELHSKCPLSEGVELLPGYLHIPWIDRLPLAYMMRLTQGQHTIRQEKYSNASRGVGV